MRAAVKATHGLSDDPGEFADAEPRTYGKVHGADIQAEIMFVVLSAVGVHVRCIKCEFKVAQDRSRFAGGRGIGTGSENVQLVYLVSPIGCRE